MKSFVILFSIVVCALLILLLVIGKYSQKGNAPGLLDGKLSKCSTKPNCVCSEHIADIDRYIEPIKDSHNLDMIEVNQASATIQEMGGVIHGKTDDYIAATFTSRIFGFVDDLEIRIDKNQNILHFRSASRVGYSDGGVNRKRIELFKRLYKRKFEKEK